MTLKNGNERHELTVDEARKGGKKSGKTRAAKKTVKKIISEIMDTAVGNASPQFSKLAAKLGVEETTTVKELFSIICIMNTLKNGDIDDAEKLAALLGEKTGEEKNPDNGILDALGKWLKDANT